MDDRRARFLAQQPFPLDRFQLEALDALDGGRSVLVTAPTGAGKTVVAEYAVHLALGAGVKAYYTTPLKALSNQKYADFRRLHGPANVGLLTGDNAINSEAPVVVMTTEVLRNMIHSERAGLSSLGYVVLDEVHFLEDRYRGGVWEEVILGAPSEVVLVCLSATVANADELAAWITQVRGSTVIVEEHRRPVELRNLFAIGDRSSDRTVLLPTFVNGRPNPTAIDLDEMLPRSLPSAQVPRAPNVLSPAGHRPARADWPRRARTYRPKRSEIVERLDEDDLLPAIYFIFSRAGSRTPFVTASTTVSASAPPPSDGAPARSPSLTSKPSATTISSCSATAASSPPSRPASPPTTPAWCPRSGRPSRRASPRRS